MRRGFVVSVVLVTGLAASTARVLGAQAPQESRPAALVERVEIADNQFLQRETLLFYVSTRAGDVYDEHRLREDFRRLWHTGLLDNLRIESSDGPRGKIVTFHVTERRRIQIVDYRGARKLGRSTIEDALERRDARVPIDGFYDRARARRVEAVIEELLAARGHPFATATHDVRGVGASGLQLSFTIDEGPRAKVSEIVFAGNEAFSDGTLRSQVKKIKTSYTQEKWLGGALDPRGDRGRIEEFYLDHGYVTARVGEPRIGLTDGRSGFPRKEAVKLMRLEIPVEEGERYVLGKLEFDGLTVLPRDRVRALFEIEEGDVYDDSRFRKAYEKLRDEYGSLGYLQWTGGTERRLDAERGVVDVTVKMDEDQRYFLGRLRFSGNDATRDKVLRREMLLNEGDVFDTEALRLSIKRINQLGYFKPIERPPEVRPSPAVENQVDVTLTVEEQDRNRFNFGGGYSGYEGAFLNASFATSNLLGRGETLQLHAQGGSRSELYSLSLSEPWFLDRRITAGADVFRRRNTFASGANVTGYTRTSTGAGLVTGVPVGKWSRAFLNYTFDVVELSDVDPADVTRPFFPGSEGVLDPGGHDPLLRRERTESRLTPSFVYSTVDDPGKPRAGVRHTAAVALAGGPLGGSADYYRPSLEAVCYLPVGKRMSLGLRAQAGLIAPFGSTLAVPFDLRYFLGGENQIRGYDIMRVGPVDWQGRAVGGNKFGLFNAEYYLDAFGPLRVLLFFDAGQAFLEGEPIDVHDFRISTGAELRLTVPLLNVPFRLIYAVNPNRRTPWERLYTPRSTFKFAIGTTF